MGEQKIYIVDTSSIIDYPGCLEQLSQGGNLVVIPQIVAQELDDLSKKGGDARFSAREAVRLLNSYRLQKKINHSLEKALSGNTPARLPNEGALFWERNYDEIDENVFSTSRGVSAADNIILGCCKYVYGLSQGDCPLVLITEDGDLSIKADSLDIDVQNLRAGKTDLNDPDKIYKGIAEVWVEPSTIDMFLAGEQGHRGIRINDTELQEHRFLWNQGVVLKDKMDNKRVIPTRYNAETRELGELKLGMYWDQRHSMYRPQQVAGIKPGDRDFGQALFFDLALDSTIKFLFVYGPAGTGKTSCAAAAAVQLLKKVDDFKKIFVMRPEYSSSETEIAPVPGNMIEKTLHWVEPVYTKVEEQMRHAELDDDIERILTIGNTGLLRGMDLQHCVALLDEFQNANRHLGNTTLTRINESTKCIVIGDVEQIDNRYITWKNSAITLYIEYLKGVGMHPAIGIVKLTKNYRNPLMKLIAGAKDFRV